MKPLKLNWNVLALVLGLTFALSTLAFTKKTEVKQNLDAAWFATDAEGNLLTDPYVPISNPQTACEDGEDYCAKQYETQGGIPVSPTGAPALMRPEQ